MSGKTPCIVITRDRVSLTRLCLASLERFGSEIDIHVVDHGSTYPAMIEYLEGCPHPVHKAGDKPPRALWQWDGLRTIVGDHRPYLVTDPDLVFDSECPGDWLGMLTDELQKHSGGWNGMRLAKIGMGLRIDDLSTVTAMGREVLAWESAFWQTRECGAAWLAPVDTTLALYPMLAVAPDFELTPALRLDAPYLIRHLPWYPDEYPEETAYYREHALEGSSHWINGGWR